MSTPRAYVGLGANLGDAQATLNAALLALDALPDTKLVSRSSLYRSAPLGYADQPDFANAVAALDTRLEPERLLAELQAIERRFGRSRSFKNAPRSLDLDLLLYDDCTLDSASLTLPHPRMHERAFVLAPLAEIAPGLSIRGRGPVDELLAGCADQAIKKL